MKKLIIITQYFLPEMGAPQNRLFELAKELQKLDWAIEIVTALPNYPKGKIFKEYAGRFSVAENISGLTIYRYWLYPSKSSRAFPRIISMLSFSFTVFFSISNIRRFKPEFLFVESPPLTLGISGWIIAKITRSKFILNVSDLWPLSAKELGAMSDGFAYKTLEHIERFLYNRTKICTGQSQQIVDYISARRKKAGFLLRNGVDTRRFLPPDTGVRNYKIIYAGLLGVAQGIFYICTSVNFKELGLEFHIYGSGNEQEIIEEFLKKNPDRGIHYLGTLDRDDIPQTLISYDAALVALIKNIYGAVPSKIYEAMAAGLPIVFSGEGEGAQIIKNNNIGWVNSSGDMIAFKDNLKKLCALNSEQLVEMKRRIRKVAEERFDRRNQIAEFHKFLISDI